MFTTRLPPGEPVEYEKAAELSSTKLRTLGRNLTVTPSWIGSQDSFWFRHESIDGDSFVIVDAESGTKRTVSEADEAFVSHRNAPLARGGRVAVEDFNLIIVSPDGLKIPLTSDGTEHYAWGGESLKRPGLNADPLATAQEASRGVFESKDGGFVLAQRHDVREVEPYGYLRSVHENGDTRPSYHEVRQSLPGDAVSTRYELYVVNTADGSRTAVTALDYPEPSLVLERAWWTDDGTIVYATVRSADHSRSALVAITSSTGVGRILWESVDPSDLLAAPSCSHLSPDDGRSLVWMQEVDEWMHLVQLDATNGTIMRHLTSGEWTVLDVLAVIGSQVFFVGTGREQGRHPYHRYLYRIDLSTAKLVPILLTPEDADHEVSISPSGKYVVDTISTVCLAPTTVLRNLVSGRVTRVAESDVSLLEAVGYRPPEIVRGQAAGTDVYGVLFTPRGFAQDRPIPVIERFADAPLAVSQPRSYSDALMSDITFGVPALAELGFAVVLLDGPGTTTRSRSFRTMNTGSADIIGLSHHRATIESIGKARPWLDLTHVGASGHAWGGYASVMALLLQPSFYTVGVASSGVYDPMSTPSNAIQPVLGSPVFNEDRVTKSQPDERAANYERVAPRSQVHNLVGHLAMIYSDLSEVFAVSGLLKFIDGIIDEGKSNDLIYLPSRGDDSRHEPYHQKRSWDYFVEHLQSREPLRHWLPSAAPR